jgi:hypothetical protein
MGKQGGRDLHVGQWALSFNSDLLSCHDSTAAAEEVDTDSRRFCTSDNVKSGGAAFLAMYVGISWQLAGASRKSTYP